MQPDERKDGPVAASPADTIRRAREHAGYDDMPESLREPFLALADLADALLAVGERDKAEIERLRVLIDKAEMPGDEVLELQAERERDRQQIARLTEALKEARPYVLWMASDAVIGDATTAAAVLGQVDAVLAGEEDAGNDD